MRALNNLARTLGDVIRIIEKNSRKATTIIVSVGNRRFIVAPLSSRSGKFRVEIGREYTIGCIPYFVPAEVPTEQLSREYDSLGHVEVALNKVFFDTRPVPYKSHVSYRRGLYVEGMQIVVYNMHYQESTETRTVVGRITPPFLKGGEEITIRPVNEEDERPLDEEDEIGC
ncbi:MAG: hypothetical protein V1659_03600 [Candidatus Woesearchaeota archaeon]